MGEVISISTNKGGVLKTSITTNLAGVLSSKGYRVLIIDTDSQGNASLSFGVNPDAYEVTLYDVMVNDYNINSAIVNIHENIDILPSNDDLMFLEFDVLPNLKRYKEPFLILRNKMKHLIDNHDYILIDTPTNLGLIQGNVLSVSDHVLIPFQPENYSMRSLVKIIKAIDTFKEDFNPRLNILGVVATLIDLRTSLHSDLLSECRKFCFENNIHMFETIIPRLIRYANSVAYEGLPATLTAKNSDLVVSYYDLLGEILNDKKINKV